jgi:hypothetical protein
METLLSLLSGGIIGGFIGAFLGGFAKFFWELWLPKWLTWKREQRVAREKILSHCRAPAIRAVSELQSRVFTVTRWAASNYQYLKERNQEQYYVDSTAFLVAQCFAWMEILRDRMGATDYAALSRTIDAITTAFSYGGPGFQIFRLEQREIGERMIEQPENGLPRSIRYSEFIEMLNQKDSPQCLRVLRDKCKAMLDDCISEFIRLVAIQHALSDLVSLIDPESRWIPADRRGKLRVKETIEAYLENRLISREKYDELLEVSKITGIIN